MIYGYVRVSTEGQNEGRQLVTMRALGIDDAHLYIDKASGKDMDRPRWHALMDAVEEGDTIVFDELSRLGRNYFDVTDTWRELTRERGLRLKVLDVDFFDSEKFDAMGTMGPVIEDMLLALLAHVASEEREKMLRRQAEGIALAKEQGRYKGRAKREFDVDLILEANAVLASGGSKAEVARLLGVHRNTVDNMIRDGRLAA